MPAVSRYGLLSVWARNGRELFYMQRMSPVALELPTPSKIAMMAVDFAPGTAFKVSAPRELFEGAWITTVPLRGHDVSPDGQHFYMFGRDTEGMVDQRVTKLNVVLNWFDELKKRAPPSAH